MPEVVIVGGGIIGASCAHELAVRGFGVTLLEAHELRTAPRGGTWGSWTCRRIRCSTRSRAARSSGTWRSRRNLRSPSPSTGSRSGRSRWRSRTTTTSTSAERPRRPSDRASPSSGSRARPCARPSRGLRPKVTGHGSEGVILAGGTAALVGAMLAGEPPPFDPSPFDPLRFG